MPACPVQASRLRASGGETAPRVHSAPSQCRCNNMDTPAPTATRIAPRQTSAGSVVLTMAAGAVLTLLVLGQSGGGSNALAQPAGRLSDSGDDAAGRISAAEQRKEMITQLRNISARLEHLESTIAKGISVKVTQLPADSGSDSQADDRPSAPPPPTTPRMPTVARPANR